MESEEKKILKRTGFATLFWVIIALLAVGGVTYAWFTFSSSTKVTPMAGAVGGGGVELTISDSYSGPFSEMTNLVPMGATENLQPVSTANLENWFASAGNNADGISNKFADVTEKVDEMTMYGQLFLKCEDGECNVYFNPNQLEFGEDIQLIAASRLGIKVKTETNGQQLYIFNLDALANTGAAESRETMSESNVVIAGVDSAGNAELTPDPSENTKIYSAQASGDSFYKGEKPLFSIRDGEIVTLDYVLYIEGCDENSINVVQDNTINMKLGFAGIEE